MKIINLKVKNIKKLVAVDITPNANVMKISGKNGAGKTSVLDAIWWALGGTKAVQNKPIRDGQTKASISLDLGELHIERRFTQSGSTLFVTNEVGGKIKSPQAVLDKLLGQLSFDPLSFMQLSAKDQVTYLRELVDLDFTDLNNERDGLYNRRTEAKRLLAGLDAELSNITVHSDTPDKLIVIADLMDSLKEANEVNRKLSINVSRETDVENKLSDLMLQMTSLNVELEQLQEYAGNNSAIDIEPIEAKINNAQTLNNYFAEKLRRNELSKRCAKGANVVKALTEQIATIDTNKKKQLTTAKFPIKGLGFNDSDVVFYDIPLSQASFSEQLKISTAMVMAFNPELRVIRITDGSMLDSESMAILEVIAMQNDFQIWIEIVDGTGEVGIYIEDGMVSNTTTKADEADEAAEATKAGDKKVGAK